VRGKRALTDAYTDNESVIKKLGLAKNDGMRTIDANAERLVDVAVLAATSPEKTGIGKKQPEFMEIAVGGKDAKAKLEFAKGILGKEVKASDVFKDGEYVDAVAVTKGKGWQGAVKRFGVAMQRRKATGRVRHVGTLGPWHPARVMYTVPMAGQMGYHKRTEINKRILRIGEKPEGINPKGGFLGYGNVLNAYLLIRGSLNGPRKRLIRFRKSVRRRDAPRKPEVRYVSLDSKQG